LKQMNKSVLATVVLWIGLACATPVMASTPEDAFWSSDFAAPAFDWHIFSLGRYGTDLIAGGLFRQTPQGLAKGVARWTGTAWQPMGMGLGEVYGFTMFRGNLIAAGYLLPRDNYSGHTRWVARWNGETWLPLDAPGRAGAFALLGDDLIACGSFAWGDSSTIAARWNGSRWKPLGSGFSEASVSVNASIVHDGLLYVAGNVRHRTQNESALVLRWAGSRWDTLVAGSGRSSANAFAIHRGTLYVGGEFDREGLRGPLMALVDSAFVPVGPYAEGSINALLDTPFGLVLAGALGPSDATSVAILDSVQTIVLPGIAGDVRALEILGGRVVAAGKISVGAPTAFGCAAWDGSQWQLLTGNSKAGGGLYGTDQTVVYSLFPVADTLFAAGRFESARHGTGWTPLNNVARWNGREWSAIGLNQLSGWVWALTRFRGELIAGGSFEGPPDTIGPVRNIARWDGSRWRSLGTGIDGQVRDLAVFQDALIVAGSFLQAGSVQTRSVARWDGSAWDAMGTTLFFGTGPIVSSLVVQDDKLFLGGDFERIGDVVARNVATWDGVHWMNLGDGPRGNISQMTFYQHALIVSGQLQQSDTTWGGLARWDGAVWQPFPHPSPPWSFVQTNALFADGTDLYVSGWFDTYGGTLAHNVVRWDGVAWRPLGSGIDSENIDFSTTINAIMPFQGSLYFGGTFATAGAKLSSHVARWDGLGREYSEEPPAILRQVRPNPFTQEVSMTVWLSESAAAEVDVFDINGRKVVTLLRGLLSAGSHAVIWNGATSRGSRAAPGVYVLTLRVQGRENQTKKIVLIH